jgi:hypothetical protein
MFGVTGICRQTLRYLQLIAWPQIAIIQIAPLVVQ